MDHDSLISSFPSQMLYVVNVTIKKKNLTDKYKGQCLKAAIFFCGLEATLTREKNICCGLLITETVNCTFNGAQHQNNKTAEIQEHQSPRSKQEHFVSHFASSSF